MSAMKYLAALAASAVLYVGANASAYEVVLNPNQRHQTIEGWGACTTISDTAARNSYRDLGMNLLRVYAAKEVLVNSSDYRQAIDLPADLNQSIAKMNFNAVSGAGNLAKWLQTNALEPSRVKIDVDPWTAPHWMKGPTGASAYWTGNLSNSVGQTAFPTPWLSNQCNGWINPGGTLTNNQPGNSHWGGYTGDSIGGRLKTEDPNTMIQYGRYMAAYAKGFEKAYGVPVYSMSLQNESTFENPFDSMVLDIDQNGDYDPTQFAKALKSVRDAFQQYGLTTKLGGVHLGNVGSGASNPWAFNKTMQMIDAIRNDSDRTLIQSLGFFASNYYMGTSQDAVETIAGYYKGASAVTGPVPWVNWTTRTAGVQQEKKPVWWMETGDGSGNGWTTGNRSSDGAIAVALKIHNALVHSDSSAYIYWSYVGDDSGGGPSEYALLASNQVANPQSSKKYDAFKQYSRSIRPGAQRIDATFLENGKTAIGGASEYDTISALDVSAFINDPDKLLTIVLLNMETTSMPVTLDVPASLGVLSLHAVRTSATENYVSLADLAVVGGKVTLNIPASSIMTLTGTIVPEPAAGLVLLMAAALLARRRR